jgi:DNA-directed RNA polymerase, mitochondrial
MNNMERQRQIESDSVRDGCVRWCQYTEYQQATDTKPYRNLIGMSWRSLADAIRAAQDILKTSHKTKLPAWGLQLLSIGHEQSALITVGTLFNMITRSEFDTCLPPRITPVAYEIGQRCRIERLADLANQREVNVAEILLSRNRTRKAAKRAAELAAVVDDEEDWTNNFRAYHLGEKLISLALQSAVFDGKPIFELKEDQEGSGKGIKKMQRIGLTEPAETWISEQTPEALDLFNPIYVPMIVEPRPWRSLSEGGYLTTPMKLVKRQTGKRAQQRLQKADLSAVYAAVNALQSTPWRINQAVCRFQQGAWKAGLPFFGLERREARARAERERDSAKPLSKGEASSEDQRKGLEKMMAFRFGQSVRLGAEERFYFPCQVDHRARVYPVPQLINPQADHIGRAPIEFADGKPLGERGAYWLAIHLANCYWKKKKVSFKTRLAWVQENEAEILDFAANPLHTRRFWTEADQPWLFLAAGLEWKRYKEKGPGMISHLPISMDGSCNGYQHLSAMGLDPIGGRATNLMPFDDPEDIYQWVSDLVCRRMEVDAAGFGPRAADAEAARQLLAIMDRELAKNATMTTPYGVTLRTIYKVLLQKPAIQALKDPERCAMYLAKLLVECIPEVAVEAGRIMEWLREVAGIIAKQNRGMMWITPAGFVVLHENRKPKETRLATADHTILVHHQDDKRKIDVRKQVDGIVAHLVHSMDAAHMMLTLNRLYAAGIRHFAMVHDSYGVHACDVDLLNRILREEFVRIYSEPVLQNFLEQQRKAHPGISLPDPPPTGDLDIQQVLSSLYFFA